MSPQVLDTYVIPRLKTKEKIFEALNSDEKFEKYDVDFDWLAIYNEIYEPKVDKDIKIEFPKLNKERIKEILMKYEFSEKRIDNQLDKLEGLKKAKEQRTLF